MISKWSRSVMSASYLLVIKQIVSAFLIHFNESTRRSIVGLLPMKQYFWSVKLLTTTNEYSHYYYYSHTNVKENISEFHCLYLLKNVCDLQINNRMTQNGCFKSRVQLPSKMIHGLNEVVQHEFFLSHYHPQRH